MRDYAGNTKRAELLWSTLHNFVATMGENVVINATTFLKYQPATEMHVRPKLNVLCKEKHGRLDVLYACTVLCRFVQVLMIFV